MTTEKPRALPFEVARINDRGVLAAVAEVTEADWVTDAARLQVKLPRGHDLRDHLHTMRYDWGLGCFLPVSTEPLDVAESDAPGLVAGLVALVEQLRDNGVVVLPPETETAITAYRKSFDGRKARKKAKARLQK